MQNRKKRKRNLPLSARVINGSAITLGIAFFLFSLFIYREVPSLHGLVQVLVSIGAGLVSAVLINILYEIRSRNIVLKMIEKASVEAWNTISKIRDDQSVDLVFSRKANKVIVEIEHEFQYLGLSRISYRDDVSIFSDFRGKAPSKESFSDSEYVPDFYFKKISINNLPIKRWSQDSDRVELCNVTNGKLFYSQDIDMPSMGGKSQKLTFNIHNTYDVVDKLVWSFQELSEDAVINIEIKDDCDDLEFFFRVNHPLAKDIIQKNIKSVGIDPKTGKLFEKTINITIHEKILPYHGFEISWIPRESKSSVE
ncbi:MAG: hypothetical protein FWC20_03640 [Oscillospiraceae bacterium]|nr:hypothetical protein [Oscillospiraceae bacterium]MCL2278484.1 hypothetical protein [Oscillospiraceae bacterium]